MVHLKEYRKTTEITSLYLFCVFLFSLVLVPYVKSIGLSDFQVSLLFAVFPLMLILFSGTIGKLSDSVGKKKIIILGIILQLLAIVLYLLRIPFLAILARCIEGIAFAAVISVGVAKLQDSLDKDKQGKFNGIALTSMQLGKMFAPLIGGLVAQLLV